MAYKIIQPKIKEDRLEHAKGSFLKVLGDENPDMKKYQGSSPYQIQKALKLQRSILLGKNPISEEILKQKINPDKGLDYFKLLNVRMNR